MGADYAGFEIRLLANLSGDPLLIHELNNGYDLHAANATRAGITRSQAKALTFGLTYGEGPGAMSMKEGISMDTAKDFISSFYEKYPRIQEWHEELIKEVNYNKTIINGKGVSFIRSPTKKFYTFEERESPEFMRKKGILTSFTPTQPKNYPMQGTGADIVRIAEGLLFREFYQHGHIQIINDIHDEILFLIENWKLDEYCAKIKTIMEDGVRDVLRDKFNFELKCPLVVEVKRGKNWKEIKQ